jgi:quercetin dioxygenase-like cupin family protein
MTDMFAYLQTFEKKADDPKYSIFSSGYTRHLLGKSADYEVYVIVWCAGAETPFHGHPDGGCWMYVVSGQLLETTASDERLLGPGAQGFQKGTNGIHKITALENSRSLHLYKPGLQRL